MNDSSDPLYRAPYAALARKPPEGPVDVVEIAGARDCPEIELEIGFGKGRFLLERGRLCPRTLLLGVESKTKWAAVVEERCSRQGLGNVVAWAGDARDLLRRIVPDESLRRVFLHFPDPWWKKRHAKRRLLDVELLSDLARLLAASGELFVQTDVRDRAASIIELLGESRDFTLTGDQGLVAANPFGAQSNRERRVEADGLPVYRILAVRR